MLIDRYLGRAQLHAFVVVFVSLMGLYFVFDAFTNMDEFGAYAQKAGGLARVLAAYYGPRVLWFFDATSPIISLASAMFALSWLERHNELTALLAAGVTRWRIARPVLVFSAVVAVLAAANREFVLPGIRESFARNAQNLEGQVLQAFEPPAICSAVSGSPPTSTGCRRSSRAVAPWCSRGPRPTGSRRASATSSATSRSSR
jgi:lipopolysaccharide export system permease protein